MKNLKVSMKLVVSFLIVIALTLAVGIIGIVGMMNINDGSTEMYERQSVPLAELAEARELFQRLRVQLRNVVLATGDIEELNSIQLDVDSREEAFRNYLEVYRPTITSPSAIQLYDDMISAFDEYERGMEEIIDLARGNADQETLMEMVAYMRPPTDFVMESLSTLMDARVAQGAEVNQSNDDMYNMLLIVIVVVLVLAVAIALVLAFYISSLISKPLNTLRAFLK